MRYILATLLKFVSTIISHFPRKKPTPLPCQFCGARDHDTDHCPNAAKYKLFHVDRE